MNYALADFAATLEKIKANDETVRKVDFTWTVERIKLTVRGPFPSTLFVADADFCKGAMWLLEQLGTAMQTNTYVNELHLCLPPERLEREGIRPLATWIGTSTSLRVLTLSPVLSDRLISSLVSREDQQEVERVACSELASVLVHAAGQSRLARLNLEHLELPPMTGSLAAILRTGHLRRLDIKSCTADLSENVALKELEMALECNASLELVMPVRLPRIWSTAFHRGLSRQKHLKHMLLERADEEEMPSFLQATSSLEYLRVHTRDVGPSLSLLLSGLRSNSSLTRLALHEMSLRGMGLLLKDVLHHCTTLEDVELSRNRLGDVDFCTLSKSLFLPNSRVRRLAVELNHLNDLSSASVVRQLLTWNCMLQEIQFDGNRFGGAAGVREIACGLARNSTLKSLSLSHCALGNEEIQLIASSLHRNATLEVLHLNFNVFLVDGVIRLVDMLRVNSGLRRLHLINNSIRDEGAELFSKLLRSEKCRLSELRLDHGQVGDYGVMRLTSSLEANSVLEELGLGVGRHVSWRSVESLTNSLPKMAGLRVLHIGNHAFVKSAMAKLADAAIKNHSLIKVDWPDTGDHVYTKVMCAMDRNRVSHVIKAPSILQPYWPSILPSALAWAALETRQASTAVLWGRRVTSIHSAVSSNTMFNVLREVLPDLVHECIRLSPQSTTFMECEPNVVACQWER